MEKKINEFILLKKTIWCINAVFNGEVFSLTEQLDDICLSDESENESSLCSEDDQPKIIGDRFPPIHFTSQHFVKNKIK